MKKLVVILQIIGLIAICPAYIALEMTHATHETSENHSGPFMKSKTDNSSTQLSPDTKDKIQGGSFDLITK